MNYGEEIAYWYLRLNGFFPITNLVIHRSSRIDHSSDCDVLAIRMPFVYEEIGGQSDDWDKFLAQEIGFEHIIGVICEVKTGAYELKNIFCPEYVNYCVNRLGLTRREAIEEIAEQFRSGPLLETEESIHK